ncbi:hypothetical protein [Paractinoplanes toevensis]|uniref:Uncharacterized protein n=1 Tax=Paractinoplanes toevensis TaxID=571911 RepID=A0A919T3Y2_9ACTN|nr:hypothetical protein [Actinoplanes toevensis]GIM88778.1 hypothetical protein Ato02nite_005710 [Actinoplanes toevensis]
MHLRTLSPSQQADIASSIGFLAQEMHTGSEQVDRELRSLWRAYGINIRPGDVEYVQKLNALIGEVGVEQALKDMTANSDVDALVRARLDELVRKDQPCESVGEISDAIGVSVTRVRPSVMRLVANGEVCTIGSTYTGAKTWTLTSDPRLTKEA